MDVTTERDSPARESPPGALPALRAAYGSTLLLAARRAEQPTRTLVSLLGARHLLQAWLVGRRAGRRRVLAGAVVDSTHSASMVAVAVACPRRRRPALASAAVAAAFAVAGIVAERRRTFRIGTPRTDRS